MDREMRGGSTSSLWLFVESRDFVERKQGEVLNSYYEMMCGEDAKNDRSKCGSAALGKVFSWALFMLVLLWLIK